ncbi:hypothetical protein Q1695_011312 [Nippostrongylus brasiliensis]|nr:hypothetical protein Q1695_011312 [Nippostrongylus brasiliensis]
MLPAACSSSVLSNRNTLQRRVKKAQRDVVLDLVTSTIDVFLSKPCDEPQVLTIRIPDMSITVAEVTPEESSKMVCNLKSKRAAENKKRIHAACAAARQFLIEHTAKSNAQTTPKPAKSAAPPAQNKKVLPQGQKAPPPGGQTSSTVAPAQAPDKNAPKTTTATKETAAKGR